MDFNLTASFNAIHDLYRDTLNSPLPHFDEMQRRYYKAKRPLLDVLGDTGRIEVAFESQATEQPVSRFKSRMCGANQGCLCDALNEDDYPLLSIAKLGSRKGTKFTRAVAKWLVAAKGRTPDEASRIVAYHSDCLRSRHGTLVISCNPWDILTCSEHAAYKSCHRLAGEYAAGPQQYLYDCHTVVSYYYMDRREWLGRSVPYKIARRLLHLSRNTVLHMKDYGDVPPGYGEAVTQLIAPLLHRLPVAGAAPRDTHFFRKSRVAYLDCVQETKGPEAAFTLGDPPCLVCGAEMIDSGGLTCCCTRCARCCGYTDKTRPFSSSYICAACDAKEPRFTCSHCRTSQYSLGARDIPAAIPAATCAACLSAHYEYCHNVWRLRTTPCRGCHRERLVVRLDDATRNLSYPVANRIQTRFNFWRIRNGLV